MTELGCEITNLYTGLMRESVRSNLHSRDNFWPTEASCVDDDGKVHGKCLRDIQYSMLGTENKREPDEYNFMTWNIGKSIESMHQKVLAQGGLLVAPNVKIRYDFGDGITVSGELDSIIRYKGELLGVEFKTFHGYFPWSQCVSGIGQSSHHIQVMLYLHMLSQQDWCLGQTLSYRSGQVVACLLPSDGSSESIKINKFLLRYDDRGVTSQYLKGKDGRSPFGTFHIVELHNDHLIVDGVDYPGITISSVMDRFNIIHAHIKDSKLVACDYHPRYSDDQLRSMYEEYKVEAKAAREKDKRKSVKRYETFAKENYADWQCRYCSYRDQCLDDG